MIQVYPLLHVGDSTDAYNVLNTGLAHFDVVLDISASLPTVKWNRHKETIKVKRVCLKQLTLTHLTKVANAIQEVRSEAKTVLVVSADETNAKLAAAFYLAVNKDMDWDEAVGKVDLTDTVGAVMVRDAVDKHKEKEDAPVV